MCVQGPPHNSIIFSSLVSFSQLSLPKEGEVPMTFQQVRTENAALAESTGARNPKVLTLFHLEHDRIEKHCRVHS